jgi:hypothetical protein
MTTIACWFNRESHHHSVWVYGDSKISTGSSTLLESGAKIFSVPMTCFAPGESGFFDNPIYQTNIGLAYAGSSLVGLNLNAALATCLSKLNYISSLPSLNDVAAFAHRLLNLYVSQLAISSGSGAACEIALVGTCPVEREIKIFYLYPETGDSGFSYVTESYSDQIATNEFVLLLGADKDRIARRIEVEREGQGVSWWRTPKRVIDLEVSSPLHHSIGGHSQLGICTQSGFDVYSLCWPRESGKSAAYLNYLGFDVSRDIGVIGGCHIGMPGMS